MRIIEQLNKLPIKSGEYLVLPNLDTPYFIIPLHSRRTFIDAISFVKSKNLKGNIKKNSLRLIPLFILRRLFPVISIQSEGYDNNFHQLILPWNQDVCNKFTIFNFNRERITLIKIGFGELGMMIRNENNSIIKVSKLDKKIIPEVVSYSESNDFIKIETIFYAGKHPRRLPRSIVDFFDKTNIQSKKVKLINHPYVNKIKQQICSALEDEGLSVLLSTISDYYTIYENELIPIVLMHSDCSLTNVIVTENNDILIDWEECIDDGIPIDVGYFKFRMQIDNGKSWKIESAIDFLVVLHYIYLQIKHNNRNKLSEILWSNSIFSLWK